MQLRSTTALPKIGYIPERPNVVLPTPESQKFMKYGDSQPSLATGTVNVSIPFYNIKVGSFSLPISFQYATNGIRPEESPHPIGYGWILQPALRVTRILIGRDDFLYHRDTRNVSDLDFTTQKSRFLHLKSALVYLRDVDDGKVEHRAIDTKVDIFTIHLPTAKINFVIEKEGDKWVGVTDGSFAKIEATEQQITVKDENGVTYIFGGDDNCLEKQSCYSEGIPWSYISAWGLKKIILANNNIISFDWEMKDAISKTFTSNHSASIMDFHSGLLMGMYMNSEYTIVNDQRDFEPITTYYIEGLKSKILKNIVLKKINFPLGAIDFNYMNNEYCTLEEIKVNSCSELVKKVNFGYNIEGDLLKSLLISGEGRYLFEYDPKRFSFYSPPGSTERIGFYPGQDYWGYYNGKNGSSNVSNLIPEMIVMSSTRSNCFIGTANRKVDEDYIQANILKKMVYPLGGFTEFEYEIHEFLGQDCNTLYQENSGIPLHLYVQFRKGGGVRLAKMITKESEAAPEITKVYKYGDSSVTSEDQANANTIYTGYGIAPAEPTLDTFIEESAAVTTSNYTFQRTVFPYDHVYLPLYITRRVLSINSQSYIGSYMLFEPNVWYNKVTEFQNSYIKTVYKYEYDTSIKNSMSIRASSAVILPYLDWTLGPNYGPHGVQLQPLWALGEGQSFFNKKYSNQINTISSPNLVEETKYLKTGDFFNKIEEKHIQYNYYSSQEFDNLEVTLGLLNHLKASQSTCDCEEGQSPHFTWTSLDQSRLTPCSAIGASSNYYRMTGAFVNYSGEYYDYYSYQLQLAQPFPEKEIISTYGTNGTITNVVEYNYIIRENKKVLKNKKKSVSGAGHMLKEEFLYPWEDLSNLSPEQTGDVQNMINSNRVTTPIQFEQKINESLIAKKIITYKDYGNGLILPQKENYTTQTDMGQVRIIYHEYDMHGNPLYITKDDTTKIVYIWSYDAQYPVAEIENASYDEIRSVLKDGVLMAIQNSENPSDEMLASIGGTLRQNLPKALVATYKYNPLIGIKEVTDYRGMTTYYDYDNWGRLKRCYMKNENNQEETLQIYNYHYRNQ